MIAYPTEYCFGLGCDPANDDAVERILNIKGRQKQQGLILLAADTEQVEQYAEWQTSPMLEEIERSWPGHVTWVLPACKHVSGLIRGQHQTVAMRVSAHTVARSLCAEFGSAIVSTSANRHGAVASRTAGAVLAEMGDDLDFILDAPVGSADRASQIRNGTTGEVIR